MDDCLFCKIIRGDIPSQKIDEDEFTYAFADIHPQAKVHEFDCDKGRAIGEDEILRDLTLLKAHHFNAVRTSHYPNHSAFYRLCDQIGLYVIDEVNLETHDGVGSRKRDAEIRTCGNAGCCKCIQEDDTRTQFFASVNRVLRSNNTKTVERRLAVFCSPDQVWAEGKHSNPSTGGKQRDPNTLRTTQGIQFGIKWLFGFDLGFRLMIRILQSQCRRTNRSIAIQRRKVHAGGSHRRLPL